MDHPDITHMMRTGYPRDPWRDRRDPSYSPPEAWCPEHEGYTTNITMRGECRECGCQVTEEPTTHEYPNEQRGLEYEYNQTLEEESA